MNRLRRLRLDSSDTSRERREKEDKMSASVSTGNLNSQNCSCAKMKCAGRSNNHKNFHSCEDSCSSLQNIPQSKTSEDIPQSVNTTSPATPNSCTCSNSNSNSGSPSMKSCRATSFKCKDSTPTRFSASGFYKRLKKGYSYDALITTPPIFRRKTNQNAAPSESVENLSGVLSTCVIQESNEELLSGSAAANGGANVTLSTSQQHPHHQQQQLMGGEMSANATLERDQGSLSQNQLPPPMPDLSPSAHLTNLTPGPVGMRRTNKASECSPFQAMTLEEITANRPPKEPTTKRECMVFEIADTEAKYVYNLGLIVECYMASTQSSPSTSSATPSIASHAYSGGLSAPILSAQQLTASSSLAAAAVDNSSLVSIPPELADRLHIVWGNIRQIYEWHRNTLLPALDSACYSNNLLDLANCFIKHERRFLMYSKYALNLPKADYILGEFDSFFIDLRKTLGLKQSLKDLLIEPIQRAMRYQLMLQGLVTHLDKHSEQLLTSEENTTHLDRLRHSLKVMTRIPKEVNDMMQLGKLFDYDAKSYGSITAQGKLILQSSIKFYAEGSPNLNASSNKKKDNKKLNSSGGGLLLGRSTSGTELSEFEARHVFLFEQSMLVAEAEKGSGSSNFIGPRYFFKHFIKGSSMNGVVAEGNNNNNSCSSASSNGVTSPTSCGEAGVVQQPQFRLECSDRNYEFVFDSSATCQQWATTITNLIMDRRDFAKALSKPIEFQKKQLLNSSNSSCNSSSSSAAPLISPNCNIP